MAARTTAAGVNPGTRAAVRFAWSGGLGFDRVFAVACLASAVGLFVDVFAHSHALVANDTFLTPFHLIMYGAFGLVVALIIRAFVENRRAGAASPAALPTSGWLLAIRQATSKWLPIGYDVTLLGAVVYGVAGAGDAVWHTVLGVERNVEALFSPTHIGLLIGAALFRTGPLRSAWLRADEPAYRGWKGLWPAIVSATCLLFSLMVFTMYVSPFGIATATRKYFTAGAGPSDLGDMTEPLDWVLIVGVTGILLHTAILMGVVLLLVDRWGTRLPKGTFTIMFTITALAIGVIRDDFISTGRPAMPSGVLPLLFVALVGGVFADIALAALAPSAVTPWRFRAFAMAVPIVLFAAYFFALWWFWGGVWWTIPVWLGMVFMPGALGYVMSFLVLQPPWSLSPGEGGASA